MTEFVVTSVSEWHALPEPSLPSIKKPTEKGSIYHLYKVGFYLIPNEQMAEAPKGTQMFGEKKILPTAVIDFQEKKVLCRLPLELSNWVSTCVSMAHAGHNAFPCDVEFGILNGRAYAEFL